MESIIQTVSTENITSNANNIKKVVTNAINDAKIKFKLNDTAPMVLLGNGNNNAVVKIGKHVIRIWKNAINETIIDRYKNISNRLKSIPSGFIVPIDVNASVATGNKYLYEVMPEAKPINKIIMKKLIECMHNCLVFMKKTNWVYIDFKLSNIMNCMKNYCIVDIDMLPADKVVTNYLKNAGKENIIDRGLLEFKDKDIVDYNGRKKFVTLVAKKLLLKDVKGNIYDKNLIIPSVYMRLFMLKVIKNDSSEYGIHVDDSVMNLMLSMRSTKPEDVLKFK